MNHVSQPTAARLREAGWKGKTEKCYDIGVDGGKVARAWPAYCAVGHPDIIPAPNLSELR
jgi:hypothetical protein